MAVRADETNHLAWMHVLVEGRDALYGVAGEGMPVLFLHGWGLTQHSYKRALKRLVAMGTRVYAPAMPGFGGTVDLPRGEVSFPGYARWIDGFCEAVGIEEPVFLIGHSFGGGVAIQVSHDFPERVRHLVLINSIGGSAWGRPGSVARSMAERPLWDWGIHFPSDILPVPQVRRVLPVILADVVPNLFRNPKGMWRVAELARRADLTPELEQLKTRGLPVAVLWGEDDKIIPRSSFEALCRAIGTTGEVVAGTHSWLLADPDAFGEVMTNVVQVARLARSMEGDAPPERRGGLLGLTRLRPRRLDRVTGARPRDEKAEGA